MRHMNISTIITEVGLTRIAVACGVSPAAVHKWKSIGRLPRTDFTGETSYAETISSLHGHVTPELIREMSRFGMGGSK